MAIVIQDFKPSGDTVEVQLPGSKKKWEVPTSDSLTVGSIRKLARGNFDPLYSLFPDEAHELLDNLYTPQLQDLVGAWTGESKN